MKPADLARALECGQPSPTPVVLTVPDLALRSTLNLREHWSTRHRRGNTEKFQVYASLITVPTARRDALRAAPRLRVTFTRVYAGRQRPFDDDNLRASLKAIRDQCAHWLRRDDSAKGGVEWCYGQERGDEPAVRIQIQEV